MNCRVVACVLSGRHTFTEWEPVFYMPKGNTRPMENTPFEYRKCTKCNATEFRDDPARVENPRSNVTRQEATDWITEQFLGEA